MKCDNCGKEAKLKIETIINGKVKEVYLCEDCFKEYIENNELFSLLIDFDNGNNFMDNFIPSIETVIDGIYNFNFEKNKFEFKYESPKDKEYCEVCGNSFSNISNGIFGCENCYNIDRKATSKILKYFNNFTEYKGQMPRRFDDFKNIAIKIKNLQEKLNETIESENYEKAADIRDEIKKLNEKVQN
ncbi:MAG: UvrB/UvrC motif-containing protein [Peptoniphilaceae bacterium]|nr:UvrB/UvrC motif-containing protein [Peptoniphilaceae bacterium]MDY3738606.1 UvrB/UvrC motif-containing protein [Peptoniphilaceae bacterium]